MCVFQVRAPDCDLTKINLMDIRQISIRYRQDHDRILVDINTGAGGEVQVWLTRRMTLRLWPLLNRVVIDHFAISQDAKTDGFVDLAAMDNRTKTMLAEFKRDEALQKTDFSTPYQSGATQHLLGHKPLLVTEVNLTPLRNGQLQLNFNEKIDEPASDRGFQMDLSSELVFAVIRLLGHALEDSHWGVGQHTSQQTVLVEEKAADEIDLTPEATRPTYLN